jgi:hypothetical protein
MNDRNQEKHHRPDYLSASGRKGNDKAPGQAPQGNPQNPVSDTQKGKNKVDGDPSRPSDKPVQ